MQEAKMTHEMARAFAVTLCIEEIRAFVVDNRADYERWLAQELAKEQALSPPKKKRVSRKGVR
jgi:hypothetical protein